MRKIESWKAAPSVPLEARVGPAPAAVVEYLRLDNIANGWPARPRPARLDAALLADINGALADVPAGIRALVERRLLGLYFVEDLGGTGYTEAVLDAKARPVAAFVVFDAAVLAAQSANTWATWKERTPFRPSATDVLEARIEAHADDDRRSAIRYILLHELGHVLAVGTDVHPPWDLRPKNVPSGAPYPFFDLSWRINRDADKYESRFDRDFPQRTRVVYYKGAELPGEELAPTYANLKNTSFPSLYAATSPFDDFAESFVTYVHVVLMKRPWEITIRKGDRVIFTLQPCWDEPRCAAKREFLERLLRQPA